MALDVSLFADDLTHMIADLPAVVVLGAITGTGALTPIDRAQTLGLDGFASNVDAMVVLASAVFTVQPARDNPITVTRTGGSAEVFRVVTCKVSPDGVAWECTLTKDVRA